MKKLWSVIGFGVIAACVLYTGFDLALHHGRVDRCWPPESPEEAAARDLLMTDMDIHLHNLVQSRNAVARRYGLTER